MRQRRAEARREAIAEALGPAVLLFRPSGGVIDALAAAFGVHRTTIWRDLQQVLWPPRQYNFYSGGELLFTVYRAYPGGPVVGLIDPEGNEIRGPARRSILRRLPRYPR